MLLQEIYKNDPWKVLVSCVLLSRVQGKRAHEVAHKLFNDYPDPVSFASGDATTIKEMLRPLGFMNIRYKRILCCCRYYDLQKINGTDILPLEEVSKIAKGKYTLDSYRIFVLGDMSTEPDDKELLAYMKSVKHSQVL